MGAIIYFRTSLQLIILVHHVVTLITLDLCKEEDFYNPYVRVKTKTGETFSQLYGSGFLDLSEVFGARICINGPAVVYEKGLRNTSAISIFNDGFLNVYTHRCFPFNELVPVPQSKKGNGKNNKSQTHETPKIPKVLNEHMKTNGIKIYGITLVSKPTDYRLSAIYQFNRPQLGHITNNEISEGTSFVVIGNANCWCTILPIKPYSDEIHRITICPEAKTNFEVCEFLGGHDYDFNKLFTDEFMRNKMYNWVECVNQNRVTKNHSRSDLQVFEPFSLNVPMNSTWMPPVINVQPNQQITRRPKVIHTWNILATNCIQFPGFFDGIKC